MAISTVSVTRLAGIAQSHFFLVQAAVLMVMISLVFLVPEHKGSW